MVRISPCRMKTVLARVDGQTGKKLKIELGVCYYMQSVNMVLKLLFLGVLRLHLFLDALLRCTRI